jgi:tRNA uridine 5-carbamoylmethylation protein Kti12
MTDVIMTVGCPGSGKTTFARSLDPAEWVVLSLDDFRAALWGQKKVYHTIVRTDTHPNATHAFKTILHESYVGALKGALSEGVNICLANTHLNKRSFSRDLSIMRRFGVTPRLRVYMWTLADLLRRNAQRPDGERCDPDYIAALYASMHRPDAWWRQWPAELIDFVPEDPDALVSHDMPDPMPAGAFEYA